VRLAVTALVEYARCARRHWLARHVGLPEPQARMAGADDPERATDRGTLAHALLAEADLRAPPLARRGLLAASASRRGRDPASPGVGRILRDVERFLDSEAGRRLAAWDRAGVLRREVPFLLRLGGEDEAPCYVDGAIDALAVGRREVWVLDFKYAAGRPEAVERYRAQLLAYALAARRAWPDRPVRAVLQFLRGGAASVDVTPSRGELERFAVEAPRLARGAARADGRDASPAALGRTEARCRAEGCGYVGRCYASGEVRALVRPGPAPGAHREARAASGRR
jgi:hypothetical protein